MKKPFLTSIFSASALFAILTLGLVTPDIAHANGADGMAEGIGTIMMMFTAYGLAVALCIIAALIALIRGKKSGWLWQLAGVVMVVPALFFLIKNSQPDPTTAKIEKAARENAQLVLKQPAHYCPNRKLLIHEKVKPGTRVTVEIKNGTDSYSKYLRRDWHTAIATYFQQRSSCKQDGVAFIETQYQEVDTTKENHKGAIKYSQQNMCEKAISNTSAKPSANYALEIGEMKYLIVDQGFGIDNWGKTPIRLIDKATGKVLAEDTLIGRANNTAGDNDCPQNGEQVGDLLLAVFSQQPAIAPAKPPATK